MLLITHVRKLMIYKFKLNNVLVKFDVKFMDRNPSLYVS